MLAIQEYISLFDDIVTANKYLTEKLHINVTRDTILVPDDETGDMLSDRYGVEVTGMVTPKVVYVYNYHSTKSQLGNPIVEEANGLILDTDAQIVSMSFPRIYNLNELHADELNWKHAMAEMHEDGTLVVVYHYKGRWFVQTKTEANAVNAMRYNSISFRVGVLAILRTMFSEHRGPFFPFENYGDYNLCYAFEYVSPYNKYITPYHNNNLILLGVFDKKNLVEKDETWISQFQRHYCDGWMFLRPRTYGIENANDVVDLTKYQDIQQKGYVVKDRQMNRVKVKNVRYRALEKLINSKGYASPKTFAQIALNGGSKEVEAHYPEFGFMLGMFTSSIINIVASSKHAWEEYYGRFHNKNDYFQKEFSSRIDHLPRMFKTIMYMMKKGKVSHIEDAVRQMRPEVLVKATKEGFGDLFTKETERLKREVKTGGEN